MTARLSFLSWRGEAAYFAIFNLTNVLNYLYLILAGFFLADESYGLFGALFGLVYLTSALGNMVKISVARDVAVARAQNGGRLSRAVVARSLTWPAGLAFAAGAVALATVPGLMHLFDSPAQPVVWAALAAALSIWVPASQGVLQGTERFPALGVVLLLGTLVRIVAGVALLAAGGGVSAGLAGIGLGFAASAVIGTILCLQQTDRSVASAPAATSSGIDFRPKAAALAAAIVIATPTSLDVAVVRHLFAGDAAGVYTGIAVLGRVIIFAAVAVPFTLLPKVASRSALGRESSGLLWSSLALTAAIALAAAAAIVAAVQIAGLRIVGTDISGSLAALNWYLAAMVAFSFTMTIIYYHIGRGDHSYILLVAAPGVVVQTLLIVAVAGSLTAVAQLLFASNAVLFALGLLFARAGVPSLVRATGRFSPRQTEAGS